MPPCWRCAAPTPPQTPTHLLARHVVPSPPVVVPPLPIPGVQVGSSLQHAQLHASLRVRGGWFGVWVGAQGVSAQRFTPTPCAYSPQTSTSHTHHVRTLLDTSSVDTWRTRNASHRSSHSWGGAAAAAGEGWLVGRVGEGRAGRGNPWGRPPPRSQVPTHAAGAAPLPPPRPEGLACISWRPEAERDPPSRPFRRSKCP